ncbi:uncharacterized protein BDCG_07632 [Blastomyces dermatitidis ER-3]|uniref:Major facilitator superfamily protein n=1 Tax=Ajellomyces dermatitidis (strain ER-3 / ATCC MYA-2586) TaxID=559297 RepID=A0ABP2F5Z4_AJEDR|nr:uncharacterized protein BDCG_07632 [Blastomyces dermatitidis ER-3]EEQ92512.1 hypothetical protein BDCG_07632 [Blastomyces dermatitidis ER-3]EQL31563.1 hypothetical protein BDFG_06138 [Blastomyces dermatitidis ATCC 26199]
MASQPLIPPFLLPRGISKRTLLFFASRNARPRQGSLQAPPSGLRLKSTSKSTKPSAARVLEKPDRFRPPSHPARRVMNARSAQQPRNYPGPRLSEAELAEKKTKRYPHMFPPEGTVMHKFLTSRGIHVWISMSVLLSLATFTFSTNFKHTSPFAHLLPPWSQLLTHPIDTISQVLAVLKMHADHQTLETAEKRKKKIDDVEKRRAYRQAHGLEKKEEGEEVVEGDVATAAAADGQLTVDGVDGENEEDGVVRERRRPIKKWLGIW